MPKSSLFLTATLVNSEGRKVQVSAKDEEQLAAAIAHANAEGFFAPHQPS